MVAHVDITDPYLHEVKGAGTATTGQFLVADGIGSANWTSTVAFGGMTLNDNGGVSEINNIGTTAQVIETFNDDTTSVGVVPDSTTDKDITVPYTGTYLVNFSTSFATLAAGDAGLYNIRLRVNGSEPSTPDNIGCQRSLSGSGDLGSVSFSSLVDLTASDVLTVWIESDDGSDTDDIAIFDMTFWVQLVNRG